MQNNNLTVICPNCKHEFAVQEALGNNVVQELEREFTERFSLKELELENKIKNLENDKAKINEQLKVEYDKTLEAQTKIHEDREKEQKKYYLELIENQKEIQQNLQKNFNLQLEEIRKDNTKRIDEERKANDQKLEDRLKEILTKKDELENKLIKVETEKIEELQRKEEELKRILTLQHEEQSRKKMEEQERKYKELELNHQRIVEQLNEAQKKASQVNNELQGEALEKITEEKLKLNYPHDKVEEVKRGQFGADIIHTVFHQGMPQGRIVYEIKNTKHFTYDWINKLKQGIESAGGGIGVIVATAFPADLAEAKYFNHSGIWICKPEYIDVVSEMLRDTIIKVNTVMLQQSNKDNKMEEVYNYIISDNFKAQFEKIIETYYQMKSTLEQEKKAMTKIWADREKQIGTISNSSLKIYSDLIAITTNNAGNQGLLELQQIGNLPETTNDKKDELF